MICYNTLADHIHQQGFYVVDEFLPVTTAQALREAALASTDQFQAGKIGQQTQATTNTTVRSDRLQWLDEQSDIPAIRAWFAANEAIANTLNQQLFLGLSEFETHFAQYPPGAFYKKHIDQFHNKQERRISCVYYLNEDWQASLGGQLCLYDREDKPLANILPIANRMICFLSNLPHEVAVTHRSRLSIAGWMKTRALDA